MIERAVIDRVEDDRWAVLLVGEEPRQVVVPGDALPAGAKPGTWLRVEFDGDALISAEMDEAYTREIEERIEDKLQRLRKRGRKRHKDD